MHPYRISCPPEPETNVAAGDDGERFAFRVLTFVGAVQVAAALPHSGPASGQTLFGAACFIAGLVWLLRHRRP
jgi:hypothetical protein